MQVPTIQEREPSGCERLFFEGVQAPVVTRVRRRTTGGLTVDQPLPFLRLAAPVRDAEGRCAHIRSIGVSVEEGTPHLVLELSYGERPDGTVRVFPSTARQRARRERPDDPRRDATVSYTRLIAQPRLGRLSFEPESPPDLAGYREEDAPIVFRIDASDPPPGDPEPEAAPELARPRRWWDIRALFAR
jgi:hypothetical protein